MILWCAEHFVYVLEWLDRRVLRCRVRWFCAAVQTPSWIFAQRRLLAEVESEAA